MFFQLANFNNYHFRTAWDISINAKPRDDTMNLEIPPSVYLECYSKKSTRGMVAGVLLKYIRITEKNPVNLENLDEAYSRYTSSKTDSEIAADILTYPRKLQALKQSPMTVRTNVSVIDRYFADACNYQMSGNHKRLRNVGLQKNHPISREISITQQIIKQLLSHSDTRMRALILVLCSSGLRIGETLSLTFRDVDLNSKPIKITLQGEYTKNGIPRIAYISDEAGDALRAWLSVRDETKRISLLKHTHIKQDFGNDNRIFPYTRENETVRLLRLTKLCGQFAPDEQTRRNAVHFHSFRKFFITQFKLAGGNVTAAECLAGHSGYLDMAYRRIPEDELAAEYLRAMPKLTINVPDDYFECKIKQADEIAKLQINSAQQQAVINRLLQELEHVKNNQQRLSITSGTMLPSNRVDTD